MNNHSLLWLASLSGDPELNSGMLVAFAFLSLSKREHQSKNEKAVSLHVRRSCLLTRPDGNQVLGRGSKLDRCIGAVQPDKTRKSQV
jgi:hypothetical protein